MGSSASGSQSIRRAPDEPGTAERMLHTAAGKWVVTAAGVRVGHGPMRCDGGKHRHPRAGQGSAPSPCWAGICTPGSTVYNGPSAATRSRSQRWSCLPAHLAIARMMVEGHGGRIRAENRPGGGARFVVSLPVVSSCRHGWNGTQGSWHIEILIQNGPYFCNI